MILVTGATGTIGKFLVRDLKAAGVAFRALVRSDEKGRALGCDFAVGDFDDVASVKRALEGVTALFLNGVPGERFVQQQCDAIDAAVAAGAERIVGLSTASATTSSPIQLARWHAYVDDHLASTKLAWSILQPGSFLQNLEQAAPTVRAMGKLFGAWGDARVAFIDAEDIAACAARLLTGAPRPGQRFTLLGTERWSYADVARKLAERLGKPVEYVDVPVETAVLQMAKNGLPEWLATDIGTMMTSARAGRLGAGESDVPKLLGREPLGLDRFLDRNVGAFR